MFNINDLKSINVIDYVKKNQDVFFSYSQSIKNEIVSKIVMDILSKKDCSIYINLSDSMYIVSSDKNWMESCEENRIKYLFLNLIPNPKLGQNASRSEVLVSCYFNNVTFICHEEVFFIKGSFTMNDVLKVKKKYRHNFILLFN